MGNNGVGKGSNTGSPDSKLGALISYMTLCVPFYHFYPNYLDRQQNSRLNAYFKLLEKGCLWSSRNMFLWRN